MVGENTFLLHALFAGVYITLIYDFLRILRRVFQHSPLMVSLEDLGFWIFCSVDIFLLMQRESDGTLRWFAVFGAMVGMLSYKRLFSDIIVRQISRVLQWMCRIFCNVFRIITKPLAKIVKNAGNAAKRANSTKNKYKCYIKNKLKYSVKLIKIKLKKS